MDFRPQNWLEVARRGRAVVRTCDFVFPRVQSSKAVVLTIPSVSLMFVHANRNHGRNKHGRGHTNRVRCSSTAKAIPKDKAIKRFSVRNIVDASALRDIRDASAYDNYNMPKLYIKQYYCIEAAVHQRIVRVRSKTDRKIREPPARVRPARF